MTVPPVIQEQNQEPQQQEQTTQPGPTIPSPELEAARRQNEMLMQQMQQMQMAMKQRQDIEQVKQDNETKRELMRQTAKAHNTETMAEVKIHDQNTRSVTAQNKVEIESIMELLLHHMDTQRLEREIATRNAEQQSEIKQTEQNVERTFTTQ